MADRKSDGTLFNCKGMIICIARCLLWMLRVPGFKMWRWRKDVRENEEKDKDNDKDNGKDNNKENEKEKPAGGKVSQRKRDRRGRGRNQQKVTGN